MASSENDDGTLRNGCQPGAKISFERVKTRKVDPEFIVKWALENLTREYGRGEYKQARRDMEDCVLARFEGNKEMLKLLAGIASFGVRLMVEKGATVDEAVEGCIFMIMMISENHKDDGKLDSLRIRIIQ